MISKSIKVRVQMGDSFYIQGTPRVFDSNMRKTFGMMGGKRVVIWIFAFDREICKAIMLADTWIVNFVEVDPIIIAGIIRGIVWDCGSEYAVGTTVDHTVSVHVGGGMV